MSEKRLSTILGHLKAAGPASSVSVQTSLPPGRNAYRYTLGSSAETLTQEQRDFYEENGFLVVKGLVPIENLDQYRERFRQICTKEVEVSECVGGGWG